MSSERDRLYLTEMLTAVDRISMNLGDFTANVWSDIEPLVAVVCMNMIVLGEGANQLSADLKNREPDVPWADMIGMRNRLAHAYLRVNLHRLGSRHIHRSAPRSAIAAFAGFARSGA